ncbi:MAG: hypothetical protein U9O65_06610 [Thermotogota bacterium]|nr:hypothetical protein [Thermotogota bacterium]
MKRNEWLKNNAYDFHTKINPSLSNTTKKNIDYFISGISDEGFILVVHDYERFSEMLSMNGRSSVIEMNINRYIGKNVKDKQEPKLHFIHMFDGIIAFLVFDNLFPEDINIFLRKAYTALKCDGRGMLICSISELETARAHQRNLHKQGIPAILGEIIENGVYQFKPPLNVIESIIKRSGFVIEDCTFENTYTAFITIQKGLFD